MTRPAPGSLDDGSMEHLTARKLSDALWDNTFGWLAYGASHEFNNKLTAIISLSDLFLTDLGPKHPMAAGLATIRNTAYGISEVLHQLAALHQAAPGRREHVDLNQLTEATQLFLRRCLSSRVTIEQRLHREPLPATIDRVWLQRVLLGLGVNAAARMPSSGTLAFATTLHSRDATAFARVEISDTGQEISRQQAALSQVELFAEAHGGRSETHAQSGRNSVCIDLPLADLDDPA